MENGQRGARKKSVGLLSTNLKLQNYEDQETEDVYQHPSARKLLPVEKRYLLAAEHGDVATVKKILEKAKISPDFNLDINCRDPLGRTAVRMAIDNENLQMLETLLLLGVNPKDGLLHAIEAQYVEAVEMLIEYEERHHREGKPYSWEEMDVGLASFTPEITPLILAAHKDNYEIIKLLLDRGASIPLVHDVKCGCRECKIATKNDCLKHSRSRISSYKALASPSLICLSSLDPILTAFELNHELRKLSATENEFKQEYLGLQKQCQKFATDLVDQVRNSEELETVLTYDGNPTKLKDTRASQMSLPRIEMAIKYKQKTFIAHATVQQLLMSIWYDGMADFRRNSGMKQLREILKIGVLFPLYACLYMICPGGSYGKRMRRPFFKFIIHSFSYLFFLLLLILASQRFESVLVEVFGSEDMKENMKEALRKQRGQIPSVTEFGILIYVIAHVFEEVKEVWRIGVTEYFGNMWNIIDNIRNSLYIVTIGLRAYAFIQEQTEAYLIPESVYIPRESWDTFDPNLIADGCFAAGNIFAALKLVHMFSINQYLGPLQVSLGRMVIDIIKFFFIYTLVLFAFACGMNQLMWYYADLERQKCHSLPDGGADWERHRDTCIAWRRFSNLFESSQTLFWASFGLIDIGNFDLTGIKDYTRFWGLLMFGSYSVINVVVLLNLLIAMMSNSYHIISMRSDVEWKFARTKLFLNYFEEGGTLPPPFNCLPNIKHLLKCCSPSVPKSHLNEKEEKEVETKYQIVMRNLVWRYITAKHHLLENRSVTEDDVNEIRQDINTFRYQMLDVFQNNGYNTGNIRPDRMETAVKKIKERERRLLKDFSIGLVDDSMKKEPSKDEALRRKFQELTNAAGSKTVVTRSSIKWRELIFSGGSPIGKTKNKHTLVTTDSLKKTLDREISLQLENRLRRRSKSYDSLPLGRLKQDGFTVNSFHSTTVPGTPEETKPSSIKSYKPNQIDLQLRKNHPNAEQLNSKKYKTDAKMKPPIENELDVQRNEIVHALEAEESEQVVDRKLPLNLDEENELPLPGTPEETKPSPIKSYKPNQTDLQLLKNHPNAGQGNFKKDKTDPKMKPPIENELDVQRNEIAHALEAEESEQVVDRKVPLNLDEENELPLPNTDLTEKKLTFEEQYTQIVKVKDTSEEEPQMELKIIPISDTTDETSATETDMIYSELEQSPIIQETIPIAINNQPAKILEGQPQVILEMKDTQPLMVTESNCSQHSSSVEKDNISITIPKLEIGYDNLAFEIDDDSPTPQLSQNEANKDTKPMDVTIDFPPSPSKSQTLHQPEMERTSLSVSPRYNRPSRSSTNSDSSAQSFNFNDNIALLSGRRSPKWF